MALKDVGEELEMIETLTFDPKGEVRKVDSRGAKF